MSCHVSHASSDTFWHAAIVCIMEMSPVVVHQVWGRCEALTAGLSSDLAEQLRLVLAPQLASKMAGEYRTGKRISMKRVIAYIASHFRKDKIWLRRTRPDKRKYQASPSIQRKCQLPHCCLAEECHVDKGVCPDVHAGSSCYTRGQVKHASLTSCHVPYA